MKRLWAQIRSVWVPRRARDELRTAQRERSRAPTAWSRAQRLLLAWVLVLTACTGTSVGAPCTQHDQCKGLPEGYCARAGLCTRLCDDTPAGACPGGARCVAEGRRRVCLVPCAKDEECQKGFACSDAAGAKVCQVVDPLAAPPK